MHGCNMIKNSITQLLFIHHDIQLVIDWRMETNRLQAQISWRETFFNKSTMLQFVEIIKNNFTNVHDCCVSRTTQELTPSDFTFKELSMNELDSFESFFTDK